MCCLYNTVKSPVFLRSVSRNYDRDCRLTKGANRALNNEPQVAFFKVIFRNTYRTSLLYVLIN